MIQIQEYHRVKHSKMDGSIKSLKDNSLRTIVIMLPGVFFIKEMYILSGAFVLMFVVIYRYTSTFNGCKKEKACKKKLLIIHLLSIFTYFFVNVFSSFYVAIILIWMVLFLLLITKIQKF